MSSDEKLHQIIAVIAAHNARMQSAMTTTHHANQKPALFEGFNAEYRPLEEGGEALPPESKVVEMRVKDAIRKIRKALGELFDVTARRDWTNQKATASIVVDGNPVLENVPVTWLMFLEKQLVDIRTWVAKLPTLSTSERWDYDESAGLYRAEPLVTHRTKKEQKPIVLYDATKEHPAQTQIITQDVLAGHWTKHKLSAAIPAVEKEALLERVDKLSVAVKKAREKANSITAEDDHGAGDAIMKYLFDE